MVKTKKINKRSLKKSSLKLGKTHKYKYEPKTKGKLRSKHKLNKKIVGGAKLNEETKTQGLKLIIPLLYRFNPHSRFYTNIVSPLNKCLSILTSDPHEKHMESIMYDYLMNRNKVYNFANELVMIPLEILEIIKPIFNFLETNETIFFTNITSSRRLSLSGLYEELRQRTITYQQQQQPKPQTPPTSVVAGATNVVATATNVVASPTSVVVESSTSEVVESPTSEVVESPTNVVAPPTNVSSHKNQSRTINLNSSLLENSDA